MDGCGASVCLSNLAPPPLGSLPCPALLLAPLEAAHVTSPPLPSLRLPSCPFPQVVTSAAAPPDPHAGELDGELMRRTRTAPR